MARSLNQFAGWQSLTVFCRKFSARVSPIVQRDMDAVHGPSKKQNMLFGPRFINRPRCLLARLYRNTSFLS